MTARGVAGLLVLATALTAPVNGRGRPAPDLRGVDGLVRAYESILEARFDQVDAELRRACPPAPREACEVLAATALWWRIQLDPDSLAHDAEFTTAADRAIAATEAWVERDVESAEAWFYVGAAYAVRVQWRVLRDEKLSAARDGKRILRALEKAIELDPGLDDAYFGMGMYKYYADVAPAAARFLRALMFLPGGDRKVGLQQMLRARSRGKLLQGEAEYQLHIIYLWYERQTTRALDILEDLREHYPGNPLFLAETARIQDEYQHDILASLASWRTLLAASREQRSNAPVLAEVRSRLAIAALLERLHQTDQAIEQLDAVVALKPQAPFGSLPLAYLRLGEAHDRLGNRAAAIQAYRSAQALAPSPDIHEVRSATAAKMRRAPDSKQAEAYRLSLTGWRLLEQSDVDGAAAALERSLVLHGGDPVARYRLGRVLQAQKNDAAAAAQFEAALRGAKNCPPPILGNVYIEAARLHERAGHRDQAISYYRIAASLFGAGAESRAAATRALARLKAPSARAPRD